jgi:hypothetical protein
MYDIYLDALLVQFPSIYGLQCWVSDTQLTSTSLALPINSRSSHRFLSAITLLLRSVGQICLQGPQILQVTLAGMCSQYRKVYLLVVRTIFKTLAVINVPMLRALVTEVLRPSKQQNITHLVKNAVRLFEIPALWPAGSERHVFLEHIKQLHG